MGSINEGVIQKLRERAERGHAKYGVTMDRTDLTVQQWLQHAQDELMDGAVYLEKLIRLNGKCLWRSQGFGNYYTVCDKQFDFANGDAIENEFEFCPFCGRKIEEVK